GLGENPSVPVESPVDRLEVAAQHHFGSDLVLLGAERGGSAVVVLVVVLRHARSYPLSCRPVSCVFVGSLVSSAAGGHVVSRAAPRWSAVPGFPCAVVESGVDPSGSGAAVSGCNRSSGSSGSKVIP